MNFAEYYIARCDRVNKSLDHLLPAKNNLLQAMRYSVLNGGKRLRPILAYATGETYGAPLPTLDIPAAAIEMMHCFSLIHDDLPAMDNDDLRRGQPTCHKQFDEATAILAGDALALYPFQILNNNEYLEATQTLNMINCLAVNSGVFGMTQGQSLDLQATGKILTVAELEEIYNLKTGALISAAVKLGAIASKISEPNELSNLQKFSTAIGLAFQIQDDILNIEGSVKKIGKNTGTDQANNKFTYPHLVGINQAKNRVTELLEQARTALKKLSVNPKLLMELIAFVVQREN